jgi:hypothetical protein
MGLVIEEVAGLESALDGETKPQLIARSQRSPNPNLYS